ncbi:MAG: carboxyl transferase domain-containing protein, partial [Nitrososphaerales archaeon]
MSADKKKERITGAGKSVLKRFEEMNRAAELGGGQERINEQHKKGKKTARERIELLLDESSFVETDKFASNALGEQGLGKKYYGDGVVTGYGTIDG